MTQALYSALGFVAAAALAILIPMLGGFEWAGSAMWFCSGYFLATTAYELREWARNSRAVRSVRADVGTDPTPDPQTLKIQRLI